MNNLSLAVQTGGANGAGPYAIAKGGLQVVGRSSPMSLYDKNLVNYNIKTMFNQEYSRGFIELWGLQTRIHNVLKRKTKQKQTVEVAAKRK